MERVIGLGGPFLKANDPKAMAVWYQKHLGISFSGTYTVWQFANDNGTKKPGYNVFSFLKGQRLFCSSQSPVMINLIVKDLFALLKVLKEEGVEVVGEPMDEEYGKFGWILDLEGNKIELWEPPKE